MQNHAPSNMFCSRLALAWQLGTDHRAEEAGACHAIMQAIMQLLAAGNDWLRCLGAHPSHAQLSLPLCQQQSCGDIACSPACHASIMPA